jgi:hypothetical protein
LGSDDPRGGDCRELVDEYDGDDEFAWVLLDESAA